MKSPSIPPPQNTPRNLALFGVGMTIAVSVPSTLSDVEDPTMRVLLHLGALVVIFTMGYLMDRRHR
jgi:uncharacterized membrane protein